MSHGSTPPSGDDRPDPTENPEQSSEGYGSPPPPPPQYGTGSTAAPGPGEGPQYAPQPEYGQAPPSPPAYGQNPPTGYSQDAPGGYGQEAAPYGQAPPPPQYVATAQSGGHIELPGVGTVRIATFGQRFLARLIDIVIVGIVFGILYGLGIGAALGTSTVDAQGNVVATGLGLGTFFVFAALGALFTLLYEVTMVALRGQTLGKMALGLRIVLQQNGQIPGWGPSFVRWIIPTAAGFICGIGQLLVYLSPLFDNSGRFQGWHDKAANDLVISLK